MRSPEPTIVVPGLATPALSRLEVTAGNTVCVRDRRTSAHATTGVVADGCPSLGNSTDLTECVANIAWLSKECHANQNAFNYKRCSKWLATCTPQIRLRSNHKTSAARAGYPP